jgi:hypothetical protein
MTIPQPSTATAGRLYNLLPEIYRVRDDAEGGVLLELIEVLASQMEVLEEDLDQLYDDQFIETCAAWAAPYLGDLIGYRMLHGVADKVRSPRAEIANTIAYRRRKGTASMLEQLARDVTDYPARAVEFFQRVTTTQYMNHVRGQAVATTSMRSVEDLDWVRSLNGAFDDLAHTADVRRIAAAPPYLAGRHNIPDVGIFLWRVAAVQLVHSPLVPDPSNDGRRFRFDATGADSQLFAQPLSEDQIAHLATPYDVPLPLGRRWLSNHKETYYGTTPTSSLVIEVGTETGGVWAFDPVPVGQVTICDLSDVPGGGGAWAHPPLAGTTVSIDPVLGRVWFRTAVAAIDKPAATYFYGAAVPTGARGSSRDPATTAEPLTATVGGGPLQALLNGRSGGGTLRIDDSDRYSPSPTVRTDPGAQTLHVTGAERTRPVVVAPSGVRLDLAPGTTVVIDGLFVTGGPVILDEVNDQNERTIVLRNCTLVPGQERTTDGRPAHPGRASLLVLDPFTTVTLESCVTGPVVAVDGATVTMTDTVIDASDPTTIAYCGRPRPAGGLRQAPDAASQDVGDGTTPGGVLDLHQCTVMGGIHAVELSASNCLLVAELPTGDPRLAAIWARRRQEGCVRFSYLPADSRTGRRYYCQPPAAPAPPQPALRPSFTSLRFGDPAYCQLTVVTPAAIRRGSEDESEMGVTRQLYIPQREDDLQVRLDEYLRFGLEAGVFYAT